MAQVLAKEYECLTCHKPIKISKIDNPSRGQKKKWERFELDEVTPRQCKKKEEQEAGQLSGKKYLSVDNDPQLAELIKQVSDLKEIVKALISQVQMLRSEVKAKK